MLTLIIGQMSLRPDENGFTGWIQPVGRGLVTPDLHEWVGARESLIHLLPIIFCQCGAKVANKSIRAQTILVTPQEKLIEENRTFLLWHALVSFVQHNKICSKQVLDFMGSVRWITFQIF